MQHSSSEKSGRGGRPAAILLLAATLVAAGCNPPEPVAGPAGKPRGGVTLRVSCPDARLAGILRPMARSWAARTGATVELVEGPMSDAADVGVLPAADLGGWADRGELAAVPSAFKDAGHPYQWNGVLAVYRGEPYAGWGAQLYGLPIAADGFAVVYRADRFADKGASDDFRAKHGRPLSPPATWEDLADVAAFFAARDKAPSLPPLPADAGKLADLFFRVAAGFDRPAQREGGKPGEQPTGDALAFAFRTDNGAPRLTEPGFVAAGKWLGELKARGAVPPPAAADPVPLLKDGKAVLAVLSFADVARLRPAGGAVDARFGVAPLPGTRGYATPGGVVPLPLNYVPLVAGGWLGAVRAKSANVAAGFELLAELGGPARSAEVVAAGGYGPTRAAHLDRERLVAWLGYGFDADRTRALQDAADAFVATTVRNPAFGLRTPDHAALTAALAAELRRVADGAPPAEALGRAAAAWEAAAPAARERERRRRAVGLP
ncbi:extracellular solute-binding protein [Urbifossiella limnaea]|uniref:Bacterial extracellular solute-binding protein n=1 Tax=Urbifossiella limnaea TaxID=2528023 RepID=A0A517XL99_9BACT|nr:extracellular solute-binding protein [Urbifossiella limnaea]QDU18291.1 Bacterial extracellular solute-binding protein [Urbifossiella limnaea]